MIHFIDSKKLLFITIFLVLLLISLNFDKLTSSFDEKLRDILFTMRGEIPTSKQVVIVDIDEKSLAALGQWPFPRIHIAQVLANLANANVGIIGIDMIFAERDRNSPHNMAKELGVEGEFRDNDALLGAVIAQTPTILGYFFSDGDSKNSMPNAATTFDQNASTAILGFNSVVNNIDAISHNAYSSGFFNAFGDESAKMNKIPLILSYHNRIYPSLALEMVAVATQTQRIKLLDEGGAITGLELSNLRIPTDQHGFLRINFRGAKRSFKYLSFVDVMEGRFDTKEVEGKFVLLGASAITLADLKATPFDLAMPGVEVHANAIDNMIQGDFLAQPYYITLLNMALLALATIILGSVLLHLKALWSGVFVALFTAIVGLLLYWLHFEQGLAVNLLFPLLGIVITTLGALYLNYIHEQQQKEFIKDKFAKKVSPEVVHELLQSSTDAFRAKEQVVSIFFSDIRGFTTISEHFDSPQELINLLNAYLEPMSDIITRNEGTIDKFIGDAIMAYWNAPKVLSNHADRAVKSALAQIEYLEQLNISLQERFGVSIEIGIGVHTGVAVVGEMGSLGRSDYTIIGDNVNLTSRIEGLTKYFGAKILISQDTKELLQENYPLRYIGAVIVKGKNQAVGLYEVMDDQSYQHFKAIASQYDEAIELFQAQKFSEALNAFKVLETLYPNLTHQRYIDKLTHENPITQAFKMESK